MKHLFIPTLIDCIINATKGLFNINKIHPCLTGSWHLLKKLKCKK